MNKRLLTFAVLAALILVAGALAQDAAQKPDSAQPATVAADTNSNQQSSNVPTLKQRDPRYRLMKNDVLVIEFPFTPEYNETVTVQPDGFINLRQLPDMHVEGMTTPELTEALKKDYSKLLHDPTVTVTLQTFLNPYFIAYGEVNSPGKFTLYGDITVAQAIGIAGGFTSNAKHSEVYLFRRVSDQWVSSQKVDVKHMLKTGNLAEDLHLQPGDMLWVPKSTVAKMISIQPIIPWNEFRINFGPY
ncbi:MAG TPA: polysaccharide biosynthesis/export family protein [Terriglobales bacterium]|nr:polysaccharide biosynthesis/export family protein [Terriglobales bacterium]